MTSSPTPHAKSAIGWVSSGTSLTRACAKTASATRPEKALLTILKIDEKNAAAYNRLGILYAKQKEFRDAIDCFEIASSIEALHPPACTTSA